MFSKIIKVYKPIFIINVITNNKNSNTIILVSKFVLWKIYYQR
jgi:hypothetical protein